MRKNVTFFERGNELSQSIKKQIIEYYRAYNPPNIFKDKDPGDWYERNVDRPSRFILFENEKVISHASVITRNIEYQKEIYLVGGLGGTLTNLAYRRKGFGSKVVRAATRYIDGKNYDLGILFCQRFLQHFYEANGWEVFRNKNVLVGKSRDLSHKLPRHVVSMVRYVSKKAQSHSKFLEHYPIFVGEEW